jgi:hypothetical protein
MLSPASVLAQTGLPNCGTNGTGSPFGVVGANGISSPFAWAFVNNVCTDLTSYITVDAKGVWSMNTPTLQVTGAKLQVRATFDSDPFISFGATTTNLSGGFTTYAFLFGTPIVPGFYNGATSTGGVTVTDGVRGNTTVTTSGVHPTYISGYGTVGLAPTNLGVDLGTAPCNASGAPLAVTTVCNQGTVASSFAPTFYDNLEALLTYQQNDEFSVASWSGAVTLTSTVTPEPATIGLFGLGLVVVGGFAARRRKI